MSRRLILIDLLFGLALALAPAAWILDPVQLGLGPLHLSVGWGWKPVVVPMALLLLRRGLRTRHPAEKGPLDAPALRKGALVWAAIFVAFLLAEGVLSLLGFMARVPPIVIADEQGPQAESGQAIVPDLELIWKFQPGADFQGRRVNRLGFLDREVAERKAPGTHRVICLGDSCTGQGTPPYSGYLHQFLQDDPPGSGAWEAFNMGVHGYSVLQGRRLFELRGADLQPDLVTIYFGWNDHWLADRPDRIRMATLRSGWQARLLMALQNKRWYVLLLAGSHSVEHRLRHAPPGLRVAPEEYEAALYDLCQEVQAAGAVPLVITAARATHLPRMLVERRHAVSVEEAVRLHDEYVAITRRTAAAAGAPLLDLADELKEEIAGERVFKGDGIHYRQTGLEQVARSIHRRIKELQAGG